MSKDLPVIRQVKSEMLHSTGISLLSVLWAFCLFVCFVLFFWALSSLIRDATLSLQEQNPNYWPAVEFAVGVFYEQS